MMGVEEGNCSTVPGSKDDNKLHEDGPGGFDEADDEPLEKSEATRYQQVAATLTYVAADRPDSQFSVKEAARDMATPKVRSWRLLKRIARYLKGRPRLLLHYHWQDAELGIRTYSDSDYAGCLRTRRSTSGGCLMIGRHFIQSFSKQQKVVALSSAEAETYALVLASCETLGMQAYAKDMDWSYQPRCLPTRRRR